jgi:hypothetical protein
MFQKVTWKSLISKGGLHYNWLSPTATHRCAKCPSKYWCRNCGAYNHASICEHDKCPTTPHFLQYLLPHLPYLLYFLLHLHYPSSQTQSTRQSVLTSNDALFVPRVTQERLYLYRIFPVVSHTWWSNFTSVTTFKNILMQLSLLVLL